MPSYPVGLSVSNHALITLSDVLRHRRGVVGTRWRRLAVGEQTLLVMAHPRKGETYADLAAGFGTGTTTAFRYIREALEAVAALAPSLGDAIEVAMRKAFVNLEGTLLRIDRVGMGSGRDRLYFSGKHKCHGMNVQVIADPAGRLIWASPALPGARHDMGAAREHAIIDALPTAGVKVIVDHGYRGSGFETPQRRRPADPETGERRRLSRNQRDVNSAHARQRGPGEHANAQLDGRSRSASRPRRTRPGSTTTKSDSIGLGTPTSRWRCSSPPTSLSPAINCSTRSGPRVGGLFGPRWRNRHRSPHRICWPPPSRKAGTCPR